MMHFKLTTGAGMGVGRGDRRRVRGKKFSQHFGQDNFVRIFQVCLCSMLFSHLGRNIILSFFKISRQVNLISKLLFDALILQIFH